MSHCESLNDTSTPKQPVQPTLRDPYFLGSRLFLGALLLLSLIAVSLGAYTRLVHAGLGCPDWPGCYGHWAWPSSDASILLANQAYPKMPVDTDKTWPEMVHRYAAGLLGMGIVVLFALTRFIPSWRPLRSIAGGLLLLVIFQGALGMWTVTLKLWPQVVTLHLVGGFSTVSLVFVALLKGLERWQNHRSSPHCSLTHSGVPSHRSLMLLTRVLLIVVIGQILLGGWTSANYAAMACPDFPTCQARWWPTLDWRQAFVVWQTQGPNYLGGQLDGAARVAIHWSHRLGAVAVTVATLWTVVAMMRYQHTRLALLLLGALSLQIGLGIGNVSLSWPLGLALAHNLGGLCLLLAVLFCRHQLHQFSTLAADTTPPNHRASPPISS